MSQRFVFVLLTVIALVIAACSGEAAAPTATDTPPTEILPTDAEVNDATENESPTEAPTQAVLLSPSATPAPATEEVAAVDEVERPAWQTIELTDARTGEAFTLADFTGQTVFVEPMATWCTNCRQQLGNVAQARGQVGEDVVFIGLSLETNLSDDALASYADNNGFNWTFAVLPPEMLTALVEEFGRSISSAPSTPHFIIRPDGTFTGVTTGIESSSQIVEQINTESGA